MVTVEEKTRDIYKGYYREKGEDRNDLLTNPEVLFQYLAFEDSIITALRRATNINRKTSSILDVGCGVGGSLTKFLDLGFSPNNLYGIDVLKEKTDVGREKFPNLHIICGDAASMPYESNFFDLVLESTMFLQITDVELSQKIAEEMLRVAKPGGYLMLTDWRYGKPGNPGYLAVSLNRIKKMFSVGSLTEIICQTRGALLPPVGRAISKHLPSVYFLLRALFPLLVALKTTLLQKRHS